MFSLSPLRSIASKQTGTLPPHNQPSRAGFLLDRRVPRRWGRFLAAILCSLVLLGLYSVWMLPLPVPVDESEPKLPPLYPEYRLRELALPQHNPDLPLPEGRHGKYLWLSNHVRGSGWGNVLQEHFANGLLAYASGRSFVFDNYTWNADGPIYSEYNGKLIPSMIPMTALIDGPLAGGPFATGDRTPRAVTKEYFDIICPEPTVLDTNIVRAKLPENYSAKTVMNAWLDLLDETPDNCVEIDDRVFDIWIFGSKRILDIIPLLYDSPMVTEFKWSPLVLDAVKRNKGLFAPKGLPPPTKNDPYPIIPGLLALHIRRGDFDSHCMHLARWTSSWTGYNQIPQLVDHFDPPTHPNPGEASEQIYEKYAKSCYPSIAEIVKQVSEILNTKAGRGLKHVYIMTNGKVPWVQELKDELNQVHQWDQITSSRDASLNWEQKYIAQVPDMLIGQRSQVFVGNGFSSFTGNIVMLRMAKGLDPEYTRLWS